MKRLLSLAIATALSSTVMSTSVLAENIAIVGGKVITQTKQGTLESGTVLIKDGAIEKVSSGTDVPSGYTKVDASGKVVTPGFVGALTSLGLVEVASWAGEVDSSASSTKVSTTGAALDVTYAINPDSTLIDVSRIEGVTSAATTIANTDLMFHGQGAVIGLDDDADILKDKAFMVVNMDGASADSHGGSRAVLWVTLEALIDEVASLIGLRYTQGELGF